MILFGSDFVQLFGFSIDKDGGRGGGRGGAKGGHLDGTLGPRPLVLTVPTHGTKKRFTSAGNDCNEVAGKDVIGFVEVVFRFTVSFEHAFDTRSRSYRASDIESNKPPSSLQKRNENSKLKQQTNPAICDNEVQQQLQQYE